MLKPMPNMALTRSSMQTVGKIKKGMPGAKNFGMQVEINISSFFGLIKTIFSLETPSATNRSN